MQFLQLGTRLTIMVTSMILSRYTGPTPEDEDDREIPDGPLYPDVVDLISKCKVKPWTRRCIANLQSMSFDEDDIARYIVRAVREGHYHQSEWCRNQADGPWAACDAYTLKDSTWNEYAGKELECTYYIKFFITKNETVVMAVSFHLSH